MENLDTRTTEKADGQKVRVRRTQDQNLRVMNEIGVSELVVVGGSRDLGCLERESTGQMAGCGWLMQSDRVVLKLAWGSLG